jgi:hypothetical protein
MLRLRRFQVVDTLMLTAAMALGIVGTSHVWKFWGYPWFWDLDAGWSAGVTLIRFQTVIALLLPGLAACTVSVLASRFLPPRPPLRVIALQPGSAACGAATLVLISETMSEAVSLVYFEASKGYLGAAWRASGLASWFLGHVLLTVAHPISLAVIAVWSVLFLSRQAQPEPSWVDRAGRLLGACWIAVALVFWCNDKFLYGRLPGAISP